MSIVTEQRDHVRIPYGRGRRAARDNPVPVPIPSLAHSSLAAYLHDLRELDCSIVLTEVQLLSSNLHSVCMLVVSGYDILPAVTA